MFREFCSRSCLPLLPQLACSIHATWGLPISGALYVSFIHLRTLVVLLLLGPVPVMADEAGEHQHERHDHPARHDDGDDVRPQGGGVQPQKLLVILCRRLLRLWRPIV